MKVLAENLTVKTKYAGLLKEVGEPVAYRYKDHNGHWCFMVKPYGNNEPLFTSEQVAAAILNVTEPLEGEIERLKQQSANRLIGLCKGGEDNDELRAQLAAAQEECEFQRNAHKQAEELMLEQSNQLAAVQEEMNDWRNQAHQSQSAFGRLQDQLAKAEQRVSEACALQVATETKLHWLDAARVAKEIRSGEWRKFMKEV